MNLLLHSSITFLMFKLERSQTAGPGEEDPVWSHRDSSRRPWNEAAGGFIPGETRGLTKVSKHYHLILKFVFFIINLLIIHVTFTQPTVCFLPVQMMALFCFLYMVYCRVQLSGDKHSAPSSLSVFHSFLRVMNRAWSIWAGSASSKICQNELKRHRHSTTRGRWGKRQRSVSMCGKSTYRWGSNPHTEHRRLFCTSVETGDV